MVSFFKIKFNINSPPYDYNNCDFDKKILKLFVALD